MCSRRRMLPRSMHTVIRLTGEPVEAIRGGQSVIFRAQHRGRQVAVKTIRITMSSDFDSLQEFCREAVAWRHLRHPNILPLLGVDLKQHRLSMVSEWMHQGNINEYVQRHGGVNRLQLLADVAAGLQYMHGLEMVHGDLKGANILVNQSHRACLVDFGLSTIASVELNTGTNDSSISVASRASLMSFTAGGTPRWMSPELLDPERFGASDDRPTKESDCYALGMVVYEVRPGVTVPVLGVPELNVRWQVLSGNPPYWDITNEPALIYAITEGHRPEKPEVAESLGFTTELWKIVQQCWLTSCSTRPDVKVISTHLNHATWSWGRRWVSV
ncbi:kinase-like domain-containing protein [Thelephora terrestris]|uniref:Kinase-like domain-containing protein n=1 Tax=Thelephora terrestris TaxID=56493 RepID=A0A9P6HD74_9AGAM|nr:kinase-like domain-containing protein [Thelephora terrestris]